ncbi:heparin lyase I family protein [Streptomyces monticola]|uniref:Heparin lyase I family protein n=1 Tax=Streptomyces monticola TaxID=2666263 RepID=A0ABW2JBA2_9ACTN
MRKRLCTLPAIVFSLGFLAASPASAAVIWNGDADGGTGVFGGTECEAPGSLTAEDHPRGKVFKFNKPIGLKRCEARGIRTSGGYEYKFANDSTYWLGWSTSTNTPDAGTVFQWKSYPNSEQNYPVLMKIEGGVLKLFHIKQGQVWQLIWSKPVATDSWKHLALGIHTSDSASGGWIEFSYNGAKQTFANGSTRFTGRTWDTLNKPKWGTYGAEIEGSRAINWVDDLKVGTSYADVAP